MSLSAVVLAAGLPSALIEPVFRNQDFVWSVGLMVAGLFFALAVLRYGVGRFRRELVNTPDQDLHIGGWWEWSMRLVVVQAVILIAWWFWQVREVDWLSREGLGNMLLQWGASMGLFALLNGWFLRRLRRAGQR